jgi:hypothetical protein
LTVDLEIGDTMAATGWIPLRNRWILHFTHVDNLPAIVESGRLVCDLMARKGLMRAEVGDPQIKESRRRRAIPVDPGGQVGEYVPFYFAPRSPMMFRIACDCRDGVAGRYGDGDRPLVYLAVTVGAVVDAGLVWVATDGNAATATTEFSSDLVRLDAMIDWPLMAAKQWSNTPDDPDRQRRRMAEFLVHHQVPLSVIHQVGAYSDLYASRVRATLAGTRLEESVFVRPGWYYGYERGR